jgi:nucleotide-binding universal stress UspA family protein
MAALMNEPAKKAGLPDREGEFVPQRIAGPVVAGVVPGQPPAVVHSAARLAYSLNVKLICAYVDITSYLSNERDDQDLLQATGQDGTVDDVEQTSAHLREHLQAVLGKAGIRWSLLTLVGEPARALARLADSADASVIVVGTREGRVGARLEQLLLGSVAVHLTHRQARPVVVIPLAPQRRHRPKEDA